MIEIATAPTLPQTEASRTIIFTATITVDEAHTATIEKPVDIEAKAGPTTVELDFSQKGYNNAAAITVVEQDGVTIKFDKGTGSSSPAYYDSGTAIRAYAKNIFTVNAGGKTITGITITFGSSDGTNAITVDSGVLTDGAWTGSATDVKFTIGGTKGNRRIKSIEVTFE